MTTRSDCPAVALRVLAVSVLCAALFLLDRVIPSSLGFEYSRIQNATLYLWLIVLPLVGYSWILLRSRRLSSFTPPRRYVVAVSLALFLSVVLAFATLVLIWISA
jgi:hypothetical protein